MFNFFKKNSIQEIKRPINIRDLDMEDALQLVEQIGKFNKQLLGTSGTRLFGEIFDEEYLAKLIGIDRADIYDHMRRSDDEIQMLITSMINPIVRANWHIEPATSKDPDENEAYKRQAEHIEYELFERQVKPFSQLIREIMSMEYHGYSLFEKTHRVVNNDPNFGTYIGYQGINWRSQRTIERFNLNRDGTIKHVIQSAYGDLDSGNIEIPGEFIVVFTLQKLGDNYEGISRLRHIYGNYVRKNVYLKLMPIGIERYAIGTPIGTVPAGKENSSEKNIFIEVLKSFTSHQNSYMVLPKGWEVDFSKGDFDAEKVSKAIEMENLGMARSFVAQHLHLGTGGNGGAYALGTDFSDTFLSIIEDDADVAKDGIQKGIIKEFIDFNYGQQKKYPKLKVSGINDKWGKEFADIIKALTDSKHITPTKTTEIFLRKNFKMNELDAAELDQTEDVRKSEPANDFVPFQAAEKSTTVQTLIFDKSKFTLEQVKQWIKDHDYIIESNPGIDETETSFRVRQKSPGEFIEGSFRTIDITDGIKAVIGRLKNCEIKFSEVRLAEKQKTVSKLRQKIVDAQDGLRKLMADQLKKHSDAFLAKIERQLKSNPQSKWAMIARDTEMGGQREYTQALKDYLTNLADESVKTVKSELPQGSIQFGEIDNLLKGLPPKTRELVKTQIALLVGTQTSDIEKNVLFALNSSINSTNDVALILKDLKDAQEKYIDGAAMTAAGGNTASLVFNTGRNEVLNMATDVEAVEYLEFVNPNPESPICQDLAGRIFRADDPEAQRFFPPLHHNCKSILLPVFKIPQGKNVSDIGLKPSQAKLEKFITL